MANEDLETMTLDGLHAEFVRLASLVVPLENRRHELAQRMAPRAQVPLQPRRRGERQAQAQAPRRRRLPPSLQAEFVLLATELAPLQNRRQAISQLIEKRQREAAARTRLNALSPLERDALRSVLAEKP